MFQVEAAAFGLPDEARLVERILASEWAVPELSLIAELDGQVVGHVLFSHVEVETEAGRRRVLALAPLAVEPDHQNRGVGAALTRAGLAAADGLGEPLVVVLGFPGYYPRFGFVPSIELGLAAPPGYPADHFFALRLSAYDPTIRGQVAFPPTFEDA